jgi:hypothetical protein
MSICTSTIPTANVAEAHSILGHTIVCTTAIPVTHALMLSRIYLSSVTFATRLQEKPEHTIINVNIGESVLVKDTTWLHGMKDCH